MNHTLISHAGRAFAALAISCALVAGFAPAASAIGSPDQTSSVAVHGKKKKAKLQAEAEKKEIKAGEKAKIKGRMDVEDAANARTDGLESVEPIILQKLDIRTNTWVNIADGGCKPNGKYKIELTFTLRATLTLRVYHPASATIDLAVSANILLKIL
ncbi:hypothetical protein AB5J62_28430 [Amycolatopsis sp. cg5]|uniref:hypothetical protein n=1 Tax=Amycolatopsis sp. cg5 TaxID=3238802 RepID=UPI0035243695